MNVFLVVSESSDEQGKITEISKCVTCHDDKLSTVIKHCEDHCESYGEDLKMVKEVATIVEHIKPKD